MSIAPLSIQSGIVCDDIRIEINGKILMIGCFGSGINLAVIPAVIPLGFVGIANFKKVGQWDASLRIVDSANQVLSQIDGKVIVNIPEQGALMPFGPMPVQIREPGVLRFQFNEGDRWKTVKTISVMKADPPAPLLPSMPASSQQAEA